LAKSETENGGSGSEDEGELVDLIPLRLTRNAPVRRSYAGREEKLKTMTSVDQSMREPERICLVQLPLTIDVSGRKKMATGQYKSRNCPLYF